MDTMTQPELSDEAIEAANAMFDAARNGASEQLLAWLDQGIPANLRDSKGDSLVMLAGYHGHTELVRELAARGADLDMLNDRGQSPLAGAVFKADAPTVDALLELGADPDLGTPSARATAAYFGFQHAALGTGPQADA